MPAKNRIKTYLSDSYYHVYNRGVDRRTIFEDGQDFNVFLSYMKNYLFTKNVNYLEGILCDNNASKEEKDKARKELNLNNFYGRIDLLAYCLLPNHFHFLLKQKHCDDMDSFMNSLCTRYSMYFNRKNGRVGPLFQGVYKAVLVNQDEQFAYLSRYIHRNPLPVMPEGKKLSEYYYSSYRSYVCLDGEVDGFLNTAPVLEFFLNDKEKYKNFVENDLVPESRLVDQCAQYLYIE